MKFNNDTIRQAVKEWLDDDKLAESKYDHISSWDTSNVTDMSELFREAKSFNQPIGDWDVSNVEDMSMMFDYAESFNQPIGRWDVSNVTQMVSMFLAAESFNQPISEWDVSNVEDMLMMFYGAKSFNHPLEGWDVSNVEDMSEMFDDAESFNQDVSKWEINKRTKTSIYDGLSFDEIMSKLESEYNGGNESVSQSTLSTETKNRSNSIQQETLSMYIPIYNVMISEKSIVIEVLKKLRESESNSVLNSYCKKHLMGSFAIPNDLKDEIDILEIKIDILQCDTYDDSDIFFDLEFDIVFNVKIEKNQAIKAIQSFEKNNHDLRWRAIPLWNQNNNNFIDSWDKTIIEERIEEIPQWYVD